MKRNLIFILIMPLLFASCSDDFLQRNPTKSVTDSNFINSETELELYSNGFYELIQDNTDQFLINAIGDMPSNSIDRYNIFLLSGAICHVQIEWLKNKAPESPEAFADFNMIFIENNKGIFKRL